MQPEKQTDKKKHSLSQVQNKPNGKQFLTKRVNRQHSFLLSSMLPIPIRPPDWGEKMGS